MGAKSSYLNTSYCDFHAFNTPAKIIYLKKKSVCNIESSRCELWNAAEWDARLCPWAENRETADR